jgi:hypothetical protein
MVATREATLRERPPSQRGRGSGARATSRDSSFGETRPARARDPSPRAAVAGQPGAISRRLFAQCAARSFSRAATSLASASLLLAARPPPPRRHTRPRPRATHAPSSTRSRSPRAALSARAERRGRDLLTRASYSGRRPTAGTPARVPEGASPVAMSDARINNPYAELDGQVRARRPTRLARASPREPPPLGCGPDLASPGPPRPNRHFRSGSPLTLRPLAALRPPLFVSAGGTAPARRDHLRGGGAGDMREGEGDPGEGGERGPRRRPGHGGAQTRPRTKQDERPSLSHVSRSTGWRRSPARGSRDRSSAASRRARASPAAGPSPSPTTAGPRAFRWTRLSTPAPPLSTPRPTGGHPPPCARVASAADRSCR